MIDLIKIQVKVQVVDFGNQYGEYGCFFYEVVYQYQKDGQEIYQLDNFKEEHLKILVKQYLNKEQNQILIQN